MVARATITSGDIVAKNGFIHLIDKASVLYLTFKTFKRNLSIYLEMSAYVLLSVVVRS